MAMYYCPQCDRFVDDDHHPGEEGPDGNLWCPTCYEQYEADQRELGRQYEAEQVATALSLQNDPDGRWK